jgi:hypothetical protein
MKACIRDVIESVAEVLIQAVLQAGMEASILFVTEAKSVFPY